MFEKIKKKFNTAKANYKIAKEIIKTGKKADKSLKNKKKELEERIKKEPENEKLKIMYKDYCDFLKRMRKFHLKHDIETPVIEAKILASKYPEEFATSDDVDNEEN